MNAFEGLRASVAEAAQELAAAGSFVGTAGNVSVRSADLVAITGTGVVLAACQPDDVTVLDLSGSVVSGMLAPSSEMSLHLAMYADPSVAAVVHTHAPFSTAVACALDELPVVHYQQLLLGGSIRVAEFDPFGTPELAAGVSHALEGRQGALMANHGAVVVGADIRQAIDHALLLEWLAALYCRASSLGEPRALTQDQQQAVINEAMRRSYGTRQPPQASDLPIQESL